MPVVRSRAGGHWPVALQCLQHDSHRRRAQEEDPRQILGYVEYCRHTGVDMRSRS